MRNAVQASTGNAVLALRKAIGRDSSALGRRAYALLLLLSHAVKIILKLTLATALALFAFEMLGLLAFIVTICLFSTLLAYSHIRKLRHGRHDGIAIGKSYSYMTATGNNRIERVGKDGNAAIDFTGEPNPHVLMIGSTSSGKTTTARAFLARVSIKYKMPFLLIDWNGENEAWASEIGATLWRVPQTFKINLFRINGSSKEERAAVAAEDLAIAARLTPLQMTAVKSSLLRLYKTAGEPTLLQLWDEIRTTYGKRAGLIGQRLRAVQRAIGIEPQQFWGNVFKGNNVVSLRGLNDSEKLLASHSILRRITELFDAEPSTGGIRLMVALDEAWQIFKREKELETAKESVAERIVRLGRKYGVGIMISTQQLEDVPKAFINSSSLLMLHQQRDITYFGRDLLELGDLGREYLRNAAQGEMFLFDRGEAQKGNRHPSYVKVGPLTQEEIRTALGSAARIVPEEISGPQMPLEEHADIIGDNTNSEKPAQSRVYTKSKIAIPHDAPSPKQYAGLLAIRAKQNSTLKELVDYVAGRGWFRSPNTLYGTKASPGIFQNLVLNGYATEKNGKYALAEKGEQWVDPDMLMANQPDKQGSEEHKQLMRKTIAMLQDKLVLAVISKEKHSFDILGIPVHETMHSRWGISKAKGYEVQTNARRDSIKENIVKCQRWNTPMVWVSDNPKVITEIERITNNRNEYLLIKW